MREDETRVGSAAGAKALVLPAASAKAASVAGEIFIVDSTKYEDLQASIDCMHASPSGSGTQVSCVEVVKASYLDRRYLWRQTK